MNKISQLGILLVCLFITQSVYAKWHTDIKEMQKALERFINNKSVSLTDSRIIAQGQPIDKKDINVKETDWSVDFTCTDNELVTNLWKDFMGHLKNTSFFYCSDEYHPKSEPWIGLRADEMEGVLVLSGVQKNVYVLTFEDKDGWDNGFFLAWDDLPDGRKTGNLSRFIGMNPKLITLVTEENRVTMDSVRTAIKIGEVVKRELNGGAGDAQKEIDTTYIDGKWAVSSEYHRKVMKALDRISEMGLNSTDLYKTVATLAEFSNTASSTELASIGFALKREAKRYNGLISPELFSMIWNELYKMQSIVKRVNPQIEDYFTASEIILRGKINESVRLLFHDERRQQYLRDRGFTVTKNEGGRWYYAVWGKHYTGNKEIPYLDGCADEDGVLKYTAEHVEANLKPGIYRLTAAGRTSYKGNTGAFIFAYTKENEKTPLLREIPANDDRYGDIWQQAAIRIREADEKGLQISPKDVRITLANGGIGYGWSKIVIDNIVVRDGTLTYGVSCDEDFTGIHFSGRWLSATDFVLERIGDLPKE